MKIATLLLIALSVAGCGCGGGTEGNGSLKGSDQTSLAALSRAVNDYGGDWAKVPPEDKKLILIRFDNDEEAAIATIKNMKKNKAPVGGGLIPPPEIKGAGENPGDEKTEGQPPGGSMGVRN